VAKLRRGSTNVDLAVEVLHLVGCQELSLMVALERPGLEPRSHLAEFIRHQQAIWTIFRRAQMGYRYMRTREWAAELSREMASTTASKWPRCVKSLVNRAPAHR